MRLPQNDRGFTLVEVIVVVVVLGLTVGVLAAAMRVGVQAGMSSNARLDLAHDAEQLALIITDDIANANTVDTAAAACVASPVIRMVSGSQIAYRVNADHSLTRHDCAAGTQRIIARNLADAAPTVVCTPSCGSEVTRVQLDIPLCARLGETTTCDPANTRTVRLIGKPRAG
jgi:prepilin-type N-terminal cleavage/methylation domain-containing protein